MFTAFIWRCKVPAQYAASALCSSAEAASWGTQHLARKLDSARGKSKLFHTTLWSHGVWSASLRCCSWIDYYTRAVFLEFTVFNPNTNLFSYANNLMEFPATGGVFYNPRTVSFQVYSGTYDNSTNLSWFLEVHVRAVSLTCSGRNLYRLNLASHVFRGQYLTSEPLASSRHPDSREEVLSWK